MFDLVLGVIVAGGLIGVAFLMFAENIVPPIPSELIMPLAGFAAAQGKLRFPGVVIAGTIGALAGAYVWYFVGQKIPERRLEGWVERYGRWLTLDMDDLDRSRTFFKRWGGWAVFLGRLVPGVRTFISAPAGLMRMPHGPFALFTALGTALWTALLAAAGYALEHEYQRVERWLDPVSTAILLGFVGVYVVRVILKRRRKAP